VLTPLHRLARIAAVVAAAGLALAAPAAAERFLTLASTTSTENSGLFDAILPLFTNETGIEVRVVAVGTGQALELGRRGDADVVLVHDLRSEQQFVREGHGTARFDVMYNDFVIVGPKSDPAGIAGGSDAAAAFATLAEKQAVFVSRGDDSGTHKAEKRLWRAAKLEPAGDWYREVGSGMGATLNTAAGLDAYTLADRGTWLSFRNRRELAIAVEGDPRLRNPYGIIPVSKAKHPHVKAELARTFVDWLVSPHGQLAIEAFRVDGEVLFHPSAQPE
jgi:tungstate transport system substrate-binding protein